MKTPEVIQGGVGLVTPYLTDGATMALEPFEGAELYEVSDVGDMWRFVPCDKTQPHKYRDYQRRVRDWNESCPATTELFQTIPDDGFLLAKFERIQTFTEERLHGLGALALVPRLVDAGDISAVDYLASISDGDFPVSAWSEYYPHDVIDHAIGAAAIPATELAIFKELYEDSKSFDDGPLTDYYRDALAVGFDIGTGDIISFMWHASPITLSGTVVQGLRVQQISRKLDIREIEPITTRVSTILAAHGYGMDPSLGGVVVGNDPNNLAALYAAIHARLQA